MTSPAPKPQETPTPRTDAYPTKLVERSIDEAIHPKGMSTHSGKVTLVASHVLKILAVSRQLERELQQAEQSLAQARACIGDFLQFRVEAVFDHRGTYSERKMAELAAIKEKHAAAIQAAQEGK